MSESNEERLARLQLAALRRAAEAAGHRAVDAVEEALFGKVGGAKEAVDGTAGDTALDNVRRSLGAARSTSPRADAPTPSTAPDPEAVARAQLAELKAQLAARKAAAAPDAPAEPPPPEPVERKRTL